MNFLLLAHNEIFLMEFCKKKKKMERMNNVDIKKLLYSQLCTASSESIAAVLKPDQQLLEAYACGISKEITDINMLSGLRNIK